MKVIETSLKGVLIIEPKVFSDKRGFFMETHHQRRYPESNLTADFVQDNLSFSSRGTLRGLHYQHPNTQTKLIQTITGEIFDVAVDIRIGSPSFGQWVGVQLSEKNQRQLFLPEGFAHGFCVLSNTAHIIYKCSDFYSPESEGGILWSDPDLDIPWPEKTPLLSIKDSAFPLLKDIPQGRLPVYKTSF